MAININSEAFCRKAYLNYHCYGNTMGLSAEDMGKITQAWSDRISSWQATVSSDENEYEFDDSDYSNYKAEGEEAGKKATGGYERNVAGGWTSGVTRGVTAGAGTVVASVGTKFLGKGISGALNSFGTSAMKTLGAKTASKGAEIATKEGAKQGGKNALKNSGSWSVAAPLALALAIAYKVAKPNKEAKEACDALQTEMAGAQATLTDTQGEMETMAEEIIALSDEATMTNEDSNEEIEERKTEYDMYMATFLAIEEKIKAGEPLTESEKELYEEIVGYMVEIGTIVDELASDTTDEVADLYDEIGSYQEGYDVAAETMGEVQGLTDYAASFDEASRTLCYVEAISQTLNSTSGITAGVKAGLAAAASLGFNAWAWACAAMGASAGVMSGLAVKEQMEFAGAIGTEIDMRKATEDINTDTMDMYSEEVDAYDGWMQGVEDLELEIPDEIAPPEGTGGPVEGEDPEGIESTEYTDYTEILQDMEEGSKVVTENEDGTGKAVIAQQYATAITMALGLPASNSGGTFGQEAIPNIIAQLIPGHSPEDILKVMNGGTLDSSYDASLIQTTTGEDTGKDTSVNNSETLTNNLKSIINFYKPIFLKASQQGWKC